MEIHLEFMAKFKQVSNGFKMFEKVALHLKEFRRFSFEYPLHSFKKIFIYFGNDTKKRGLQCV
jgi:hypothetical protein